jgi:hypothetical protein
VFSSSESRFSTGYTQPKPVHSPVGAGGYLRTVAFSVS